MLLTHVVVSVSLLCTRSPSTTNTNAQTQIASVQHDIDKRLNTMFGGITVTLPAAEAAAAAERDQQQEQQKTQSYSFPDIDDAAFAALGRDQPSVLMALLESAQSADKTAWQGFQAAVQTLKLQRQRLNGQLSDARALLDVAQREAAKQQGLGPVADKAELLMLQGGGGGAGAAAGGGGAVAQPLKLSGVGGAAAGGKVRPVRIVLVCGFESFNVGES